MCFSEVPFALKIESETFAKSQELKILIQDWKQWKKGLLKYSIVLRHKKKIIHKDDFDDSFTHLATLIVTE